MPDSVTTSSSLLSHLPGFLVLIASLLLLTVWVFLHLKRTKGTLNPVKALGRLLVAGVTVFLLLETLSRLFVLATPLSWILLSALGAILLEGVLFLYRVEQKIAAGKYRRKVLALRIAAVSLVLLILSEPVLERYINRALKRVVVLLVDQSDSMELSDPQRSTKEWIDLGIFYKVLEAKDYAEKGKMAGKVEGKSVEEFFALLEPETREALQALNDIKRSETLKRILKESEKGSGIIQDLNKKYDVKVVGFAASPQEITLPGEQEAEEVPLDTEILVPEDVNEDWKRLTRLTTAFEYTLEQIPPEQLAGVVVLSDFRNTGRGYPEAPVMQLADRSVPVFPVLLGSGVSRHDLAVTQVDAPESIFKGERLKVEVDLKLYGVPGQKIPVKFMRGERLITEEMISVPEGNNEYRTVVAFADQPEEDGILAYSVRLDEKEDEVVLKNNRWDFQTAVSEDRTNVLLVDSRPRWEFRYLRNLFYGRDKSIHLQYVLTDPDNIASMQSVQMPPRPKIIASASRTFGDAEASHLPETLEEWRKFDIIILGDVPPETLTNQQLNFIETCVSERGAALIVIAGPTYMPHKFDNLSLQRLLPITYDLKSGSAGLSPEPSYRMMLTQEGRRNPMMQLGNSVSESDQVWRDLPPLKWRYPAKAPKPGATILAYAQPSTDQPKNFITADLNPSETAARIREMNEIKERNNLVVYHSFGLGKVLMLNYDRTWRLRYRVGDTYHHRFWGRVATWGAGENLRAGNEFIRLGTDAITYSPDEKVKVSARILQENYQPVTGEAFDVEVFHEGVKVSSHTLKYREQSQGMYDVEIGPFAKPGVYPIRLASSSKSKVKLDGSAVIETEFQVATSFNPVEWGEFSADTETAQRIASSSNAEVLPLAGLDKLEDAFGPGSKDELERADITLWDHWFLFLCIVAVLTSEWILRKKGGLL